MIDLDAIAKRDKDYDDIFEEQERMRPGICARLVAWPVADRRALLAYVRELLAVKDALLVAADVAHDDAVAAQAERDALISAARKVTCADCEALGFEPASLGLPGKGCLSCRALRALLPEEPT